MLEDHNERLPEEEVFFSDAEESITSLNSESWASTYASAASNDEPYVPGCKHYARRCMLVCATCDEAFWCRLCHDAIHEASHTMDRFEVREVVCTQCSLRQPKAENCKGCGVQFASYFCTTCCLYSDLGTQLGIYHCDKCNICRQGGRDNFFHCDTCQACLANSMQNNHKCLVASMRNACPVCLDDMFSSTSSCSMLECGHMLHTHCLNQWIRKRQGYLVRCPNCSKSAVKHDWDELANRLDSIAVPAEQQQPVNILCQDCEVKSVALWHPVMCRCTACGSFNTVLT